MNSFEVCSNRENGRHDLNGRALVMLVKKLRHDALEKFWGILLSNGWMKGVGRAGDDSGTVGAAWLAGRAEVAEGRDVPDGLLERPLGVLSPSVSGPWGSGFRLCSEGYRSSSLADDCRHRECDSEVKS